MSAIVFRHIVTMLSCRYLLNADLADINKRDRWDSVPLYYACLAGHADVAAALLEAGAVCNEYTFDGDRCHYAGARQQCRPDSFAIQRQSCFEYQSVSSVAFAPH